MDFPNYITGKDGATSPPEAEKDVFPDSKPPLYDEPPSCNKPPSQVMYLCHDLLSN